MKELCNQVGSYYPERQNFRLTPEVKEKFTEKLRSDPKEFCGRTVSDVVRTDGLKLIFEDGSRVCYRLSGTEPVVRCTPRHGANEVGEVERGGQTMDFRVKKISRIRRFPSPQDGLRAMASRAPQAEALAASWIEGVRPLATQVYVLRRRIATMTVAVLAGLLFVHVMFGANGMIVYKRKRADYESLQRRIAQEQKENELYTQRIHGLKTDHEAIEKEAREQLRYVRPGEYVYVPPAPVNAPPANHSAKK